MQLGLDGAHVLQHVVALEDLEIADVSVAPPLSNAVCDRDDLDLALSARAPRVTLDVGDEPKPSSARSRVTVSFSG
jgi:hypothetical protein